uniref:Phosphatidylinositol N-acetylglucosaminyltransferase subunit H conserved domain-containing protein n=1 Tax=Ananas comosus var. bracteatus TaxID=296719 RepID=A0A6V7PE44_ANACO|nr:unnamed protein product [Ananas comosus var. bracteatus]
MQDQLSLNSYSYKHYRLKDPSQAIDIHDVFIKKSRMRVMLSYAGILSLLVNVYYSLVMKENLCVSSIWSILVGVLFAKCLQYKPVKKESVVIMRAFGVQLETHFWSGKVNRRFIPIGKILKPVLNECVTPVTCYWSLALILRDEDELMLVFRVDTTLFLACVVQIASPVKILVPVWKALCAAADYDGLSCPTDPQQN